MKAPVRMAALLLVLCAGMTVCPAADAEEAVTDEGGVQVTLWAYPPALEFVDNRTGGHGSGEIGLTGGLWPSGAGPEDGYPMPRFAGFWYPGGDGRGVAVYGAMSLSTMAMEAGLYYVWRSPRGGASVRVGVGWLQPFEMAVSGVPGFGAAVGFAF